VQRLANTAVDLDKSGDYGAAVQAYVAAAEACVAASTRECPWPCVFCGVDVFNCVLLGGARWQRIVMIPLEVYTRIKRESTWIALSC
jgi:radical SAM superfamily enzyme YgiQ (UPF0313 family)